MKIGIMTFHWATNYGAVLQAYALQSYLQKQGHDVQIIRYHPLQNMLGQRLNWIRWHQNKNFRKEKLLREFRKRNLVLSKGKYPTNASLRKVGSDYDLYISGSDQVWNYSFIQHAEYGRETYSYYLDFVDPSKKKIAYAASLGTNQIDARYAPKLEQYLKKFEAISVRERTASEIVGQMHCESSIVCDPTLLLDPEDYRKLLPDSPTQSEYILSYKLHNNQHEYEKIEQHLSQCRIPLLSVSETDGIADWLYKIANAGFVITNSFHGTVFSILFHVPFLAVGVEHSDMDERFHTLLSALHLEHRFLRSYDAAQIEKMRREPIDWQTVDTSRCAFRTQSQQWLCSVLEAAVS